MILKSNILINLINILDPIECITDANCPDFTACGDDNYCVHPPPCPNCAANARCELIAHARICTCLPFYGGDPYIQGCEKYGEHCTNFGIPHGSGISKNIIFISLPVVQQIYELFKLKSGFGRTFKIECYDVDVALNIKKKKSSNSPPPDSKRDH